MGNGMTPYYARDGVALYCGDAFDVLREMDAESVNLIVTDPPYYKVKGEWWDNQWDTSALFLSWIGRLCDEFKRVLVPNGSVYVFASPQMCDGVKAEVARRFRVLNTIRWYKNDGTFSRADVTLFRTYCETWEAIVFAEQRGADGEYQGALIDENSTYWGKCEETKRAIFGDYLRAEFKRAGVTNRKIAALFPSETGGLTGCVSNWLLGYNCPTPEQYEAMRHYLNAHAHGDEYLQREYEYLRREYEELRREYEELRREYEELRRPFYPTTSTFRDTWFCPQVESFPGKHPTEKPTALLENIVRTSSRKGDIVADFFTGRGASAIASRNLGRSFVGCDISEQWCAATVERLSQGSLFPLANIESAVPEPEQMPMELDK